MLQARGSGGQWSVFDEEIFAPMIPPEHPPVAIDRPVDFSFIN